MMATIVRGVSVFVFLVVLAVLMGVGIVGAQPVEVPPTYGGDFWSRPRLTGNWVDCATSWTRRASSSTPTC